MDDYQIYQSFINDPNLIKQLIQSLLGIQVNHATLQMHHHASFQDFTIYYLAYLINDQIHIGIQLGTIQYEMIELMADAMVEAKSSDVFLDIEIIISNIPWDTSEIECFQLSKNQYLIAFSRTLI